MRTTFATCFLLWIVLFGASTAMNPRREEEDWKREREREWEGEDEEEWKGHGHEGFLLRDLKKVIKTPAGYMEVARNIDHWALERPMHIGFLTMEPKTLFIPQYMDTNLIIFIRRGAAKLGVIYKDELSELQLKIGDIYRIPAGSVFYLVNTGEGQRLHVICSIDPSESTRTGYFQSFFVGGGTNPSSVLSGFGPETLSTAFNVTIDELGVLMEGQQEGPIVFLEDSVSPRRTNWSKFLQVQKQRLERAEDEPEWVWRKLFETFVGKQNKKSTTKRGKSPDSYNIYDRRHDFSNDYGWSIALDESDYNPLKHSGIGVYLVNLTAGSMMAPHWNPRATEYGVVLKGSGKIHIVYPNGTRALSAEVNEGDVFWIPRFFPFCQIASRTGPFEFFGFTTSAQKNRPQFLAGASSVLRTVEGPELAASFGVNEEDLRSFLRAQRESIILPSAAVSPPYRKTEKKQ